MLNLIKQLKRSLADLQSSLFQPVNVLIIVLDIVDSERLFLVIRTYVSGHCCFGEKTVVEVKIRVNVWTVCWDRKKLLL